MRNPAAVLLLLCLPIAVASAQPADVEVRANSLVERLRSAWMEERSQAAAGLAALGAGVEGVLVRALRDPDRRVRQGVCTALGAIATPGGAEALLDALEADAGTGGELRESLLQALAAAGPVARAAFDRRVAGRPEAGPALDAARQAFLGVDVEASLQRLVTSRNVYGFYSGQFTAVLALGPRVAPVLWRMFADPAYRFIEPLPERRKILRMLAAWALVDARDENLVPEFERLLVADEAVAAIGLERAEVEDAAVLALWNLGRREPLEALVRRLEDAVATVPQARLQVRARALILEYRTGQYDRAVQHLQDLMHQGDEVATWAHYCLACVYAVQNRVSEAIHHLRYAVEARWADAEWIRLEGDFANLRGNPEFEELVRKVERLDRAAPKPK